MNWKELLKIAIQETLNKDHAEPVYKVNFINKDSFEILKRGEQILITEYAENCLSAHWSNAGRNAVKLLRDQNYSEVLKTFKKIIKK